ncbi:MAG: cation:dicarboxylase symporter family transporter [Candidatus Aminicenantes bacterium]|nr:cation:dicarboxylase symporter family transporter [Candidatus Aminicenantes bacterium]
MRDQGFISGSDLDSKRVAQPKKKFRLSLSTSIFLGLILGIMCGIFFGEDCSFLAPLGDVFLGLMKMSIMPYIMVSLIVGIGSLSKEQAKLLLAKGGLWFVLLITISIAVILLIPLSFPTLTTASFFSKSMLQPREGVDFIRLFIPSNPFQSLVNSFIPAIVLFSIAIGVALMGLKNKQNLIQPLATLSQALTKIAKFVIKLAPLGIFGIAASAAGTVTLEELGRLQAYFLSFIVTAILLVFWILPTVVTTFTPFSYRDVLKFYKDALITAFATDSLFIVLPLLIENSKELFKKYKMKDEESAFVSDIVIPISFNFPLIGRLMSLLFVFFTAWFYGSPIPVMEYPKLVVAGFVSLFSKTYIALPFLLDILHIPTDIFELYHLTQILNGRFATLVSTVHLLVLTILVMAAIQKVISFRPKKFVLNVGMSLALVALSIIGIRSFLGYSLNDEYTKDKVIASMQLLEKHAQTIVHTSVPTSQPESLAGQSALDRIRANGVIRVGYSKGWIPFSYFNQNDELVGFDVEMAHILAKELNVDLEFIPTDFETVDEQLNSGIVDIIMAGVPKTTRFMKRLRFSDSYLDLTLAIAVEDHRRREFQSIEKIQRMRDLKIGIPFGDRYYNEKLKRILPSAEIVILDSVEEFFQEKRNDLDALIVSAEGGSAWTLIYPQYQIVIPESVDYVQPVGYPIPKGDPDLVNFINGWLEFKKKDGTIDRLYNYWILGIGAEDKGHRWSIIRDVLHWVD